MKIRVNNKSIVSIMRNNRAILYIYTNGLKIWPEDNIPDIEEVISCFYNGYWIDEYPWSDDTPWTD